MASVSRVGHFSESVVFGFHCRIPGEVSPSTGLACEGTPRREPWGRIEFGTMRGPPGRAGRGRPAPIGGFAPHELSGGILVRMT